MKFRNLKAEEIDVRVDQCQEKYFTLLLYKDARVDMDILDETVGCECWQREHTRDNANCRVGIYFDKLGWVYKEDTGTESYTEKEKGLASDSFKRACVNWGIGRELYTAPNIFVNSVQEKNYKGKLEPPYKDYKVDKIVTSENKVIQELFISAYNKNTKQREVLYPTKRQEMPLKDTKQEKSINNSITLENAHKIKVKNKAGQEIKLDSLSISQLELVVAKGGDLGKLADLLLEEKYNDTTAEDMNEAMKSLNEQTEMKC